MQQCMGRFFFSLKYRINAGSEAYYGFISHEFRLQKKKDPQVPTFRILRIFFVHVLFFFYFKSIPCTVFVDIISIWCPDLSVHGAKRHSSGCL